MKRTAPSTKTSCQVYHLDWASYPTAMEDGSHKTVTVLLNSDLCYFAGFVVGEKPDPQMALLSVFKDKKDLCQRSGVPYAAKDWVGMPMPTTIVTDRGQTAFPLGVAEQLGICIRSCPSYWPNKHTIEAFFLKLGRALQKAATADFTRIVIKEVIAWNSRPQVLGQISSHLQNVSAVTGCLLIRSRMLQALADPVFTPEPLE